MDGIINVLKPPGMTSHDVVSFLRKKLKTKKVGHTGTLDPEAAGVLPVCIGKATRTVQYLTDKTKVYIANIKFGVETDSCDKYGEIVRQCVVEPIQAEKLNEVLKSFMGLQKQIPPIYSAIKVDGKKLYQYALAGEQVEIQPRDINIYDIKLLSIISNDEAIIEINCSKGTYVRSICRDIGIKMNSCAHMSQLVRTCSSPYIIEQSITLEEIDELAANNRINEIIQPIDTVFSMHPKVAAVELAEKALLNGNSLCDEDIIGGIEEIDDENLVRVYFNDTFTALGIKTYSEKIGRKCIKIKNLFI